MKNPPPRMERRGGWRTPRRRTFGVTARSPHLGQSPGSRRAGSRRARDQLARAPVETLQGAVETRSDVLDVAVGAVAPLLPEHLRVASRHRLEEPKLLRHRVEDHRDLPARRRRDELPVRRQEGLVRRRGRGGADEPESDQNEQDGTEEPHESIPFLPSRTNPRRFDVRVQHTTK